MAASEKIAFPSLARTRRRLSSICTSWFAVSAWTKHSFISAPSLSAAFAIGCIWAKTAWQNAETVAYHNVSFYQSKGGQINENVVSYGWHQFGLFRISTSSSRSYIYRERKKIRNSKQTISSPFPLLLRLSDALNHCSLESSFASA